MEPNGLFLLMSKPLPTLFNRQLGSLPDPSIFNRKKPFEEELMQEFPGLKQLIPDGFKVIDSSNERMQLNPKLIEGRTSEFFGPGPSGFGQLPHPDPGNTVIEIFDPIYRNNKSLKKELVIGELFHAASNNPKVSSLREQFKESFTPKANLFNRDFLFPRMRSGKETFDQTLDRTILDAYIRAGLMPSDPQSTEWLDALSNQQRNIISDILQFLKTGN